MRTLPFLLAAIAAATLCGGTIGAQGRSPWRITEQTPRAQYTKLVHDAGAEINLFRIDQFNGRTSLQVADSLQSGAMARAGCSPLRRGSLREVDRATVSVVSAGGGRTCSLTVVAIGAGGAYSFSIDARDAPVGAHADAVKLLRAMEVSLRRESTNGGTEAVAAAGGASQQSANATNGATAGALRPAAVPSSTVQAAVQPPVSGSEGALRAAVAAIPASNRPFGMVLHSEVDVVNGGLGFSPYMLFPNGYAVDKCRSWNLATTAPTPAALRAAGTDCDVLRWRKVGNKYQLQDTDGAWFDESDELAETTPFRLGQRVNYAMGYVGGGGVSGGLSTVNTLNSGEIRLTPSGEIGIGAWNSVVYNGPGAVASSSGPTAAVKGQYLLDGHVLAIRDASGVISYGLIFLKVEEGKPYLYVNGKLYWAN
jgi:hypothetical protein